MNFVASEPPPRANRNAAAPVAEVLAGLAHADVIVDHDRIQERERVAVATGGGQGRDRRVVMAVTEENVVIRALAQGLGLTINLNK